MNKHRLMSFQEEGTAGRQAQKWDSLDEDRDKNNSPGMCTVLIFYQALCSGLRMELLLESFRQRAALGALIDPLFRRRGGQGGSVPWEGAQLQSGSSRPPPTSRLPPRNYSTLLQATPKSGSAAGTPGLWPGHCDHRLQMPPSQLPP